jgi:hypothetical protein
MEISDLTINQQHISKHEEEETQPKNADRSKN